MVLEEREFSLYDVLKDVYLVARIKVCWDLQIRNQLKIDSYGG